MEIAGSLTDRAVNAAAWRMGGALVGAVFQFGIGVLLARLLTPADFGLVALAFVVLGLTNLFGDLGMSGAIVQRRELTERHIRVAFTFSVVLGFAIAILVVVLAPLGAMLMKEPRLVPVLRWMAVGFAVRGLSVVAGSLLRRRLDFKRAFFVELSSTLLGYAAVAVTLALMGYGVWSLVWGGLFQGLLSTLLLLGIVRHTMWPLFLWQPLRELLHFGAGYTLNGFVNYVALNGDNFVIGRWIGSIGLGLYSRAYALMNLPLTYTASIMSSVLFPAFAQVQADHERLQRAYILATRLTALTAAPVMAGMAVAAPHLIRGIYGPGWEGTILPLQILCAAGYFRALYHLGGSVTQGSGKIYWELFTQVGYALLVLGGSVLAAPHGIAGVAAAVAVAILYMYSATAILVQRICRMNWRTYLQAQVHGIGLGFLVGASALLVRLGMERINVPSLAIVLILVLLCAIVWIWFVLVVVHTTELQMLANRIPARFYPLSMIPIRVHRRLWRRHMATLSS